MAAPVALTDSEDEPSPGQGRSLHARYEALEAMSQASLAGEQARKCEMVLPEGSPVVAINVGEEPGRPARTASFELQYDALDAGAAVAAVAAASPLGGQGRRAPGFGARDVTMMLRQRAEWFEQLGDSAVLLSEDLSDQSSEWGGSDASGGEAADVTEKPKHLAAVASAFLGSHIDNCSVVKEPLEFERSRRRFADPRPDGGQGAAQGGGGAGRLDPPSRRLLRLRAEADALCGWAEAHGEGATGSGDGTQLLTKEAGRLQRDAGELAGLVQRAAAAGEGAPPKRVWLPPSERLDAAAVQQLLMLSRLPTPAAGPEEPNHRAAETAGGGLVYQLSAVAPGGGRLAAAGAGAPGGLGERLALLRAALGAGPAPAGGSLAGAAAHLHRRLDALLQVSDPESCDRLCASVRLLAAEVQAAASEARHLEALEAEEREGDLGAEGAAEEVAADYVPRLHERVAGLDAVALRVADIDGQLAEREALASELGRFASDIASAEARALHAGQVLRAAAKAAERMREAAEGSREQLARNVAALEAKLAALAPAAPAS